MDDARGPATGWGPQAGWSFDTPVAAPPVPEPVPSGPVAPPVVPWPTTAPARPGAATAGAVLGYLQAGSLLLTVVLLGVLAAAVAPVLGVLSGWLPFVLVLCASVALVHALGSLFLWRGTGRSLFVAAVWGEIGVVAAVLVAVGVSLDLGAGAVLGLLAVLVPYSVLPVLRACLASTGRVRRWVAWRRGETAAGRLGRPGPAVPWVLAVGAAACVAVGVVAVGTVPVATTAAGGAPTPTYGTTGGTAEGAAPVAGGGTAAAGGAFSASVSVPTQSPDGVDAAGDPTDYSGRNVLDADPTTCWRMAGDGSGQVITFTFSRPVELVEVGLVNGYAKVDPLDGSDRYAQERRLLSATWVLDDGRSYPQQFVDGLRDDQRITLPPGAATTTLQLRIGSTTAPEDPGFDYTAISDVVVRGR